MLKTLLPKKENPDMRPMVSIPVPLRGMRQAYIRPTVINVTAETLASAAPYPARAK